MTLRSPVITWPCGSWQNLDFLHWQVCELERYSETFKFERVGAKLNVESDHKPLESVMKKPLCSAPPRLQRMLLRLQKYDMLVMYKPGKSIPVADALSRKYLNETDNTSELMEAHMHLIVSSLPVSDQKLKDIKDAAEADLQCKVLKKTILDGWPDLRKECPVAILEYRNHRDERTVLEDIIMKGDRIVIPKSLRKDMLHQVHYSHLGIEK